MTQRKGHSRLRISAQLDQSPAALVGAASWGCFAPEGHLGLSLAGAPGMLALLRVAFGPLEVDQEHAEQPQGHTPGEQAVSGPAELSHLSPQNN